MLVETRCTECRDGLVCSDQWQAWYARADELEAAHLDEHGDLTGLGGSSAWLELLEERPSCPEESDCTSCSGSGVIRSDRHSAA